METGRCRMLTTRLMALSTRPQGTIEGSTVVVYVRKTVMSSHAGCRVGSVMVSARIAVPIEHDTLPPRVGVAPASAPRCSATTSTWSVKRITQAELQTRRSGELCRRFHALTAISIRENAYGRRVGQISRTFPGKKCAVPLSTLRSHQSLAADPCRARRAQAVSARSNACLHMDIGSTNLRCKRLADNHRRQNPRSYSGGSSGNLEVVAFKWTVFLGSTVLSQR